MFPRVTIIAIHFCFLFLDAARTQVVTLSLHDALPIYRRALGRRRRGRRTDGRRTERAGRRLRRRGPRRRNGARRSRRSEEHTSELQSPDQLVCRLLLEKKNSVRSAPPLT